MKTAYAIAFGIIVLLGYLANPKNKINRGYCLAGVLFWIGAIKEPLMDEILPFFESIFGISGLCLHYEPVQAIFTWILYTIAAPTLLLAVLNLKNSNKTNPKNIHLMRIAMYIPGLIILLFFSPLMFIEYRDTNNPAFWIVYTVYNYSFGIAYAIIAVRGFRAEKNIKLRKQKQRVALLFLPLLCFWLISIFIPRLISINHHVDNTAYDLWQLNLVLMLLVVITFLVYAFKDGFMGLRIVTQRYNWNDKMDLINMSATYTNHMFKQQVSTMELCINQLKEHYITADEGQEVVERLNILSRSILTLKNFVDRINRHSQIIQLTEEPCRITDLLADAVAPLKESGLLIRIDIADTLFLICDKVHMTEVFTNILINSSEAIQENGMIEITAVFEKSTLRLMFKDNGEGIDPYILNDVFKPHFSTKKSKEKNYGLGLYYCKNVITAHNGRILAESIEGKETTIIIAFPSKRVLFEPVCEADAPPLAISRLRRHNF